MNTIAWNCFATVMNMHIKRFLRPAALMFIIGAGAYAASSFPYSPSVAREVQASETDKLIQEGLALLRAGKFDEALANSAKAASLSPDDFRPHVLAGYAYGGQHNLKSASDSFATAIRLEPRRKETYLSKAQVDYLRNVNDAALLACKKAIEIDPNYVEAYLMIGNILRFKDNQRAEAIEALQNVIRLNPKIPQAYDYLGEVYESAKDEKKAEEIFRQGMAADPKHMAGRFTLGRMLVKQGRLAEARELWESRTSDEDRTWPQFIVQLKRAETLKAATDALAKSPKDPDTLIKMGNAVMEGDPWVVDSRQKRAVEYFRQALELKPDSVAAQSAIVKAYIQLADFYKEENKNVDLELVKLRKLDAKLADEMEAYRKTYHGALVATPAKD